MTGPKALLAALSDRVSGRGRDRGLSTVEVVILAPVMILFILVLVAFGQLVDGRGALDGAARDAARAGSIQKDPVTAMAEARKAAEADLGDVCSGPVNVTQTSAGFVPDTLFTVEVSCEVRGLAMIGLDVPTTLQASFSSPLDPFRRAA
ncbi:TadE/TadG family type IV pilus assembly protein [Streptomyces triticiradicis]|uniref:TadE/TadG family type IV pilus assembly protein n=1 Tax=Streptomyces triticiradicis TaxID=2651189 RepID=UPI00384A8A43